MTLFITGDANRASGSVISMKEPCSSQVETNSPILRIRWPFLLSRIVRRVTTTSVAANASGDIPMSWTTLL